MILLILHYFNGRWEFLTATMCIINFLYFVKNFYYMFVHRKSNKKLRQIFFIDGGIQFCHSICFSGATVYFLLPNFNYCFFFTLPYLVFGVYICFLNHGENEYTGLKVFSVIEALQFLLIALKVNDYIS